MNEKGASFIRRKRKEERFTRLSNEMLQNDGLSWKARGLLSYMLSMPDDWVFYETELVTHSKKDGITSLRSAMKELKEFGYVVKEPQRDELGKITNWVTYVDEEPINHPDYRKPTIKETHNVDNQTLLTTDVLQTNNNINNFMSVDKSTDVKKVINHYKTLKNLPQPKKITSVRESSINARIKDFGLEEVIDLLTKFNDSEFVAKYHREERKFMSFDWIFTPTKFTKLAEGAYFWMDNKKENNEMELEDIFS